MTTEKINHLLEMAWHYCGCAEGEAEDGSIVRSEAFASAASAHAATAQAMMMFDQWQEYNRDALENARTDHRDYTAAK